MLEFYEIAQRAQGLPQRKGGGVKLQQTLKSGKVKITEKVRI